MLGRFWKFSFYPILFASQVAAGTISIQYSVTPLGGNVYKYVYSVNNDGSLPGSAPVQAFDIYFDTSLYSTLQILTPNSFDTQWSQQIFAGGVGYPAAYDVCAIPTSSTCSGVGIPANSTLTGFSVQFDWLGSGAPGSQPFDVFAWNSTLQSFDKVQSGQTATPEPSSLCMVALALSLAAYGIRRRCS